MAIQVILYKDEKSRFIWKIDLPWILGLDP